MYDLSRSFQALLLYIERAGVSEDYLEEQVGELNSNDNGLSELSLSARIGSTIYDSPGT